MNDPRIKVLVPSNDGFFKESLDFLSIPSERRVIYHHDRNVVYHIGGELRVVDWMDLAEEENGAMKDDVWSICTQGES